jgi:exodeoxyribonuclease VII large subunit
MPASRSSFSEPSAHSAGEPAFFTVSALNRCVREAIEQGFPAEVWVEGEVSNHRKQASGHQYFTLKDAQSQVACVWFARGGWRKQTAIQDGMQVRVCGRLAVYEVRGQYQINVGHVEAAGAGLLQARFEALKRKLAAEGLFDPARKKPLPPFPRTVALVTSPTGAALRDMLKILERRAPWLRIVLAPVRVQGAGAAAEIAAAIELLNTWREAGRPSADLMIVGRGGGSAEDLWEFNEEIVARALAASAIPVISAVGHEIDFTLCDFAADLRAPTPSAAAELATPDGAELARRIALFESRLRREILARIETAAQRTDLAAEALARAAGERVLRLRSWLAEKSALLRQHRPDHVIRLRREGILGLDARLSFAFRRAFDRRSQVLARLANHLRLLSPEATIERGYSVTLDENGALVTAPTQVRSGERLTTRTAGGEISSRVEEHQK